MTRNLIVALIAVTASAAGLAIGMTLFLLPEGWSRIGVIVFVVLAWGVWEAVHRTKAPPLPSDVPTRFRVLGLVLAGTVGLLLFVAMLMGWLPIP